MTRLKAAVQAAVHRSHTRSARRIAEIPAAPMFRATVTAVTAGAGSGGGARVTVTWRGSAQNVADYPDSYTPAVNHRVLCALVDNQLSILHRCIGYPT